jgi:hypothetical protein
MANKAFVVFTSNFGMNNYVHAYGSVVSPDDGYVADVGGTYPVHYSDTAQSIHERVADSIRIQVNDPDLIVIFVDAPGRY